jgi:hypothetical protein
MGITSAEEFMNRRKGGRCDTCLCFHPVATPCNREALSERIKKLLEVTSGIPELMKMNQEATQLAQNYRNLLVKADEAHGILVGILAGYGEIGNEIRIKYLEKLDKWARKEPSNPDTSEQLELFAPKQSILSETDSNNSTKTKSGSSSASDSLN